MAYTQTRTSKTKGARYIGADGKPKVAGTFPTERGALQVAQAQETSHPRRPRRHPQPTKPA